MAIPIIHQTGRNILHGLLSGAIGGLVAGPLFGAIFSLAMYLISGTLPGSLIEIAPAVCPAGLISGLIIGSLIGSLLGASLIATRPYIKPLSQLIGIAIVTLPTIALIRTELPIWVTGLLIGGSIAIGFIGGTVAYRCYQRLST